VYQVGINKGITPTQLQDTSTHPWNNCINTGIRIPCSWKFTLLITVWIWYL